VQPNVRVGRIDRAPIPFDRFFVLAQLLIAITTMLKKNNNEPRLI
jgi:hypothetical protein